MDPLTLAALLSGGTSLAGLFMGGGRDAYDALLRRIQNLTSPQAIGADAAKLESQIFNSAGFSNALRGAAVNSNTLSQRINQSLASRGLTNTGVGAVTSPLARSAGAFAVGNLRASASTTAYQLAQALAQMRVQALSGAAAPGQTGRDLLGGGISSLFDVLRMLAARGGTSSTDLSNFDWSSFFKQMGAQ